MNGSAHSFDQRKRSRQKVTQKIAGALILTLALGTMVSAQDTRIEISPFFGYTLSEGINVNPDTVAGIIVDQVNPTNGISYGVMFNVNVNENMQVGFLYDNQESNLELKGRGVLGKTNVADLKVRNYHAIFTYIWGDSRDSMRPYLFGGLGATQYSPGDRWGLRSKATRSSRRPGEEASSSLRARTSRSTSWGVGHRPISNRTRAASGAHRFGRAGAGSSPTPIMPTSSSSRAASRSLSRQPVNIGPRPSLRRDVGS